MTFPDDPVLVGVLKYRADFYHARDSHWYRVPYERFPIGIDAKILGLFSPRRGRLPIGGVYYYAEILGIELVYRRWLLPRDTKHPRANEMYYRLALGDLIAKRPPIVNPSRRVVVFVRTTWGQFINAREIKELY